MQLTPLGCLAGMPSNGQASSGYLVRQGETSIMLDAGPGTALALSGRFSPRQLDAVFVSHQHTDHIYDLLPIGKMLLGTRLNRDAHTGQLSVDDSVPRVPLFVPRGAEGPLRQLAALFPVATHPLLDRAFDLAFDVYEYEAGETLTVGLLLLRFELLEHVSPNCGIRIEGDDSSLVYTGDTGVTEALANLAEGAGTLLAESTLRETDASGHGHLSSADAGRAANDAGVSELILTHFPSIDPADHEWHRRAAAAEFDGPIAVATPDHTYAVAPTVRTASGKALT